MAHPIIVFTILKNSREQVRVSLKEYHGHQLIDLRIFDSGGFPTKSGVSLQVSHLPALREAIDIAITKAAELGLLMEELVPCELGQRARRRRNT